MLFCGRVNNIRVGWALEYLPDDIFDSINGKIAFIMLNSDACRLTPIIREHEEIIILSPWIFPYKPFSKNDKEFRYFIFCVLHEVAHVLFKHKSPLDCSVQENQQQENEADDLALNWFNKHISEFTDREILLLSIDEIKIQQEINQKRLASLLGCD